VCVCVCVGCLMAGSLGGIGTCVCVWVGVIVIDGGFGTFRSDGAMGLSFGVCGLWIL